MYGVDGGHVDAALPDAGALAAGLGPAWSLACTCENAVQNLCTG
jgi:hypothetical protein